VLIRRQRGFSLIELMMGLAIMAILLFAAVPTLGNFVQNRKIRTAAEAVTSGLNVAKAEAVRRNTSVAFTLDSSSGWVVGCATVSASCPGTIQQRYAAEGTSNITTTSATVTFNGYGLATSLLAGSTTTIAITNPAGVCEDLAATGTMRCLKVLVTPGGQVRMCDPKLTLTTPTSPQAC
jgi:type IV fimbrial biogenesis protein FimT